MGRELPRKGQGVTMLRVGRECLLCDRDGHPLYALNETAAAVWELCDGETTLDEIVDAVCLVCRVERAQVLVDLERTLEAMARADLIQW